jgi:hypothetical protein
MIDDENQAAHRRIWFDALPDGARALYCGTVLFRRTHEPAIEVARSPAAEWRDLSRAEALDLFEMALHDHERGGRHVAPSKMDSSQPAGSR